MAYSVHNFSTGDKLYASQLNAMDAQIAQNDTLIGKAYSGTANATTNYYAVVNGQIHSVNKSNWSLVIRDTAYNTGFCNTMRIEYGSMKPVYFDSTRFKCMVVFYDADDKTVSTGGSLGWITTSPIINPQCSAASTFTPSYWVLELRTLDNSAIDWTQESAAWTVDSVTIATTDYVETRMDSVLDRTDIIDLGLVSGYYVMTDRIGVSWQSKKAANSNSMYAPNGIALNAKYVGKTMRIRCNTYGASSGRCFGFCDANGIITKYYMEKLIAWVSDDEGLYFDVPITSQYMFFSISKDAGFRSATITYNLLDGIESKSTAYVSPSGSDTNAGITKDSPFLTIQKAISDGYKTIVLDGGSYKGQKVVLDGLSDISIIGNCTTLEDNLHESHQRRKRPFIDNSIDISGLTLNDGVYSAALSVGTDSTFYKVFVAQSLAVNYSGAEYYGRVTTYNAILWEITGDVLTCKRLKPVLTLADCKAEQGTFYYDGTTISINPTDGSITGKTFKRLNYDTTDIGITITNCNNILIQGVNVGYFNYNDIRVSASSNVQIKDCECSFTSYRQTFDFAGCDATCISCMASHAGADGFGISTYGNVSFYDCSAIKCYDDGISHHDGTSGVIDGGTWQYCLKGGIMPSFGSNVTVRNAVCKHNPYGVYIAQSGDRTTDATLVLSNVLSIDNTTKDIKVDGYTVDSFGCVYRTKEVTNGTLNEYGNTVLS